MTTPKSRPAQRPEASSSSGIRRVSTVPGSTVLRMTTTWYASRPASARPISRQTFSTYVRLRLPLSLLGVPTQTRLMSLSRTAADASMLTRRRPAATVLWTSASSPGSTTGACPRLSNSTFCRFTSTPTTS